MKLTRRAVLATAGAAPAAGALRVGVRGAGFVVDRLTFRRGRQARQARQAGEALRAEVVAAGVAKHPGVTRPRCPPERSSRS